MRVEELMTRPAITCHVNDFCNTAAHLMWEHDCGAIVVVRSDGHVGGMITDRDICMAALTQGLPLGSIVVNSAMAHHVATVRPDQDIVEVERLMAEHQVHRMPVVDADNRPVGFISMNDIIREAMLPGSALKNAVSRAMHTLAAIIKPRMRRRRAA